MTSEELQKLLTCEDDRVEWKLSLSTKSEDLLQTVCALANDLGDSRRPGFLLIGVHPKGKVEGIGPRGAALDKKQQELASKFSNKLWPKPAFDIHVAEHEGKTLLVVRVDPFEVPPAVTVDGVAYVRRGSTTWPASDADILRLKERRPLNKQPFDARPWIGATLDDLEVRSLRDRYDAAREDIEDQDTFPPFDSWLTQLQLGAPVQGTWTPNAAALLIFGKSPQSFFPGATVELVRYAGTDVDAPVSWRKPASGTLPSQLDVLWAQMNAHVALLPTPSEGIRSSFLPEYPVEALKELARNMVQHRLYEGTHAPGRIEWYDDRIEFSNPGGPFMRASEGEFGSHSDYRNQGITMWLKELGYVEQLGRGVRRVRKLLDKNGNPPLEVEVDGFTRVIVRRTS